MKTQINPTWAACFAATSNRKIIRTTRKKRPEVYPPCPACKAVAWAYAAVAISAILLLAAL